MVQAISVNSQYQITVRGDFGIVHTSVRPNGQVIAYNETTKQVFITKKSLTLYINRLTEARRNGSEAEQQSASLGYIRAITHTNDAQKTASLQEFITHVASREIENIRLGAVVGGIPDAGYRKQINDHAKEVEKANRPSAEQARENRVPVNDMAVASAPTSAQASSVTPFEGELLRHLTNGVVALVFKKVTTGETREMLATLNPTVIGKISPQHASDLGNVVHRKNTLSVFDITVNDFRKFKSTAVFPIANPAVSYFAGSVPQNDIVMELAFLPQGIETPWLKVSTGEYTFMEYVNACTGGETNTTPRPPKVDNDNTGLTGAEVYLKHIRPLVERMQVENVQITFEKYSSQGLGTGEIRHMVASRNPVVSIAFSEFNEPVEMEKQFTKRRVPVIDADLGEKREFNIDRFISYVDVEGNTVNVRELAQLADAEYARNFVATRQPNAADVYTVEQMIAVLDAKVVRAVVRTSSSDYRVMMATRNPSVIDMHEKLGTVSAETTSTKSPEERRAEMIEKGQIAVFDIEKQGWITLVADNLHEVDTVAHVPSWIEFDWEFGDWFAVMQGRVTPQEGYTGTGFIGRDMLALDRERLSYESRQFRYHTRKQEMELLDNSWKNQLQVAYALKNHAVASVMQYTSQDIETLDVMREFAYGLQRNWSESLDAKTEDATLVFSDVKELVKEKIIIVRFNWGRDVIFLHPRFVVNASSHKVYADRLDLFNFPKRALSNNVLDVKLQGQLEQMASYVSARRKADILTKELDVPDMRRLKRLHQVIKNNKATLEGAGIKFGATKAYPTQVKVKLNNKAFVSISPEYILDDAKKQFIFVRTQEVTYASEIEPKVSPNAETPIGKVLAVYLQACDLRRTVRDDNGNPM